MNAPSEIITLLITYKYAILAPLSVIEGPIVAIIVGFLTTLGIFNIFISYVILVIGDALGDSAIYAIGRWGSGFTGKHGHKIGITVERIERTKEFFKVHHHKAVTTSKLLHGIGFTGLLVAGNMKIPYWRYVKTCGIITIIQSAVMLIVGVFFGHAYQQIAKYINYYAAIVSVGALLVLVIVIFFKYKNKKIDDN